MLGKQRDVETNKEKREQRTIDIMRLIDRVLQVEGFMSSPYDERKYVFEIKENIIIDEMKRTETMTKQLEAGVKSRKKVIAILNGGLSEAEAEEEMKIIDEEIRTEEDRQDEREAAAAARGAETNNPEKPNEE